MDIRLIIILYVHACVGVWTHSVILICTMIALVALSLYLEWGVLEHLDGGLE